MYLLYDIGGTKTRVAYSKDGKRFEKPFIFDTPHDFKRGVVKLVMEGARAVAGRRLDRVAIGIAGPIARDKKTLLIGPNIPDWGGKPLVKKLSATFGVPVSLENDAALVALGEAHYGAGKGKEIVAYLTVSTGVGGSRIVNGLIDDRSIGFEPGRQIVDYKKGTRLEQLISGTSVTKKTGKQPFKILDKKFWDEMAHLLATGLNNTIVHWSPDVVVVGGSMMKEIGIPLPAVRKYLKKICTIYPTLPEIRKGRLGDLGGLYGALVHARQMNK